MIVAMSKELKTYFEKLGTVKDLSDGVYEVWHAKAYGNELYIVKSGVGEIAAAAAAHAGRHHRHLSLDGSDLLRPLLRKEPGG